MTILLSAFLVAAGGSYVVYRLVGKQISRNASRRSSQVVVAAHDIEIGAIIKATDLKTAEVVGEPPKDVVLKPEAAVGRGVLTPLYAGEPVIEKRLAAVGSGGGLAATIHPGMRACAVKVNEVVGLAGFVVPGMRVDVIISGHSPGLENTAGLKVKTLLQNIEVLSAGKDFQRDNEGKPEAAQVVNLLVTPEQAEILSLASGNETHIQLVLRNPIDHEITHPPGTQMANLFGGSEPKAPPPVIRAVMPRVPAAVRPAEKPAPPPVFVIQVTNGAKHTEERFAIPGDRP
jgi:pilus assembly protein CpaB